MCNILYGSIGVCCGGQKGKEAVVKSIKEGSDLQSQNRNETIVLSIHCISPAFLKYNHSSFALLRNLNFKRENKDKWGKMLFFVNEDFDCDWFTSPKHTSNKPSYQVWDINCWITSTEGYCMLTCKIANNFIISPMTGHFIDCKVRVRIAFNFCIWWINNNDNF